jgi:hypothetical protein
MKKIYSLAITFLCFGIWAQVPGYFTYQGVIRDAAGLPYANRQISIKTSIIDSASATATVQYAESHKVSTTDYGLYSITVGKGSVVEGNFANITWIGGNKFLKVEFDPLGENNYILSGITQILSVPYALVSEKVKGNFLVGKVFGYPGYKDTLSNLIELNNFVINASWLDGDPENIEVDIVNNPGNLRFKDDNGLAVNFPQIFPVGDNQVLNWGLLLRMEFESATPGIHPVRFRFKSLTSLQEKTRDCIIKLSADTLAKKNKLTEIDSFLAVVSKYNNNSTSTINGKFECYNGSDSLNVITDIGPVYSNADKLVDGNFDARMSANGPNLGVQYINFTFHFDRFGTKILGSSGAMQFTQADNVKATLDPSTGIIKTQFTYLYNDTITRTCKATYTPTK